MVGFFPALVGAAFLAGADFLAAALGAAFIGAAVFLAGGTEAPFLRIGFAASLTAFIGVSTLTASAFLAAAAAFAGAASASAAAFFAIALAGAASAFSALRFNLRTLTMRSKISKTSFCRSFSKIKR